MLPVVDPMKLLLLGIRKMMQMMSLLMVVIRNHEFGDL